LPAAGIVVGKVVQDRGGVGGAGVPLEAGVPLGDGELLGSPPTVELGLGATGPLLGPLPLESWMNE
jgi:hypothetical protein